MGGVGRAAGRKFSAEGFDVIALYHTTDPGEAESVVRDFGAGNHSAISCDLRNESAVTHAVDAVIQRYGHLDAAIHAAVSPIVRKSILALSATELEQQFGAGVFGGLSFFRESAEAMKRNAHGGALVGILSQIVMPGLAANRMAGYVVGKYALRGMLKELLNALTSTGVRVNAIAPDFMDTPLNKDMPKEVVQFILERSPGAMLRTPDEVADAVVFLCSPAGAKINGKIFSRETDALIDL